jgi:hypothetical protein
MCILAAVTTNGEARGQYIGGQDGGETVKWFGAQGSENGATGRLDKKKRKQQ